MTFSHHDLLVELNDDWWAEADMAGYVPKSKAYRSLALYRDQPVYEVCIEEVGPVFRAPGVGIFNDSEEDGPARARVLRLFRGFQAGDTIPPVQVLVDQPGYGYRYKLVNGTHRLYCSLAVGFTHVPAVDGFDWKMLDR